jgi:signal peptidase I
MVYVDGKQLEEDYIKELTQIYVHEGDFCQPDKNGIWEGKVPEDHFFVLGDNRVVSKDSRAIGYISKNQIVGEAVFRVFPISSDKFGFLD